MCAWPSCPVITTQKTSLAEECGPLVQGLPAGSGAVPAAHVDVRRHRQIGALLRGGADQRVPQRRPLAAGAQAPTTATPAADTSPAAAHCTGVHAGALLSDTVVEAPCMPVTCSCQRRSSLRCAGWCITPRRGCRSCCRPSPRRCRAASSLASGCSARTTDARCPAVSSGRSPVMRRTMAQSM